MALQSSGTISLNDIHQEAGGSSGTYCTINDSDIRGLIGKSSGASMAFNEWYGASATFSITFNPDVWVVQFGPGANQIRGSGVEAYGSWTSSTSTSSFFGGNAVEYLWNTHNWNPQTVYIYLRVIGIVSNTSSAAFSSMNINGTTLYRSSASHAYSGSGSSARTTWTWTASQGGGISSNIYPIYAQTYPNSTVTFT